MSTHSFCIPIILRGPNLGTRHRYLNSLVTEAYDLASPIEKIIALPESSPIDRLFKIDLASRHKHVDYIRENLQDDDMLYVSKALKAKWLLDEEYRYIFTPVNLENILYPQMITTAVNKMKHWILLNLRDSVRCQEFYEYYFDKDVDYAFKFLCKCPLEIILKEFPKPATLTKMTPHRFKILCEKSPTVAKIFYEMLTKDQLLLKKYIVHDYKYFNSLKCILKVDTDIFLNITEEHFMPHFKKLSTSGTKFVMSHQKNRFLLKPEWYTARLLNIKTLAQCLTQEECEELVIKLAEAQYLETNERWFNYKNVEPFVKRLDIKKRGTLKKKVFVDKDFGEVVKEWPYAVPKLLSNLVQSDPIDVFIDIEESPAAYDFPEPSLGSLHGMLACGSNHPTAFNAPQMVQPNMFFSSTFSKAKTLLDFLFDEYRFASFDKTLFEVRQKITSESSSQNRMYMMLILVSKSGGKAENLSALFKLLMDHRNEPSQVRAAIVRSLVNRACIWRTTEDIWKDLLIFGRGLGLDGGTPEADCVEGLHAVVIRNLLLNRDCDRAIKSALIKSLSTNLINHTYAKLEFSFTSYSLTTSEKQHLNEPLLNILLESANTEVNPHSAAQILGNALVTLQAFNVKLETRPNLIESIKNLVTKNKFAASGILKRLFDAKLGRKELFRQNFDFIQTDSSYVNALKHDITILSVEKFLQAVLINQWNLRQGKLEQFFRKVSIYFNENEDLASCFLTALVKENTHKTLARPIAYFIGENLKSYMLELDTKDSEAKRFSASIRANAHLARPAFKLDSLEVHKCGAKLIANKVLICKAVDINPQIQKLLTWKRTARLAIILAQRANDEADVFAHVAKLRPTAALKSAITYFGREGDQSDLEIWGIVKPLFTKLKKSITTCRHLMRYIMKVDLIPLSIRSEYATEVFQVINETHFEQSMSVLCHIKLLPNIKDDFIEMVLYDYITNRFVPDAKMYDYRHSMISTLYLKLLDKYLVLSKTEETQNRRFEKIGQLYLDRLQSYWESTKNKTMFFKYLTDILQSLKNNKAFINEEYVSCLLIMEKFDKWMRGFIPVEKYFSSYVPLHVSMLYYKAVRQANKLQPGMLTDEEKRRNEGFKLVGKIFGKYVGHEARLLTKTYFDSISIMYSMALLEWIYSNFNNGRFRMIPYIIKGILEVSEGIECTVALPLFNFNVQHLNDDEKREIRKCFEQMNHIEMQFCYYDIVVPAPPDNVYFSEFPLR